MGLLQEALNSKATVAADAMICHDDWQTIMEGHHHAVLSREEREVLSSDEEEDGANVEDLQVRLAAQRRERATVLSRIHRSSSALGGRTGIGLAPLAVDGEGAAGSPPRSAPPAGPRSPLVRKPEELAEIFVSDIPVHAKDGEEAKMRRFQRVVIEGAGGKDEEEAPPMETRWVCKRLLEATQLRRKYVPAGAEREEYWGALDRAKFEALYQRDVEALQSKGGPASFRRRLDPPFHPFPETEDTDVWTKPPQQGYGPGDFQTRFVDGVVVVEATSKGNTSTSEGNTSTSEGATEKDRLPAAFTAAPSVEDFYDDLFALVGTVHDAACKSLCFRRLKLLESLFGLHVLLNAEKENAAQKSVPHRDFYNIRKVDTHIHHSAIMNQKHLLRFIKSKLRKCPNEVVIKRDGQFLTLSEVFRSLGLTAYDLSIDTLDMHADNTFHRFDRFNLKYNPVGESRLREVFLKSDNLLAGRYLAEITQEVFADAEANKYVMMEPRISIYGRARGEWAGLGAWFFRNRLASPNIRWMVQIPRLFQVYKKLGLVASFEDMLQNIFAPLFAVTLDPASDPQLHCFLKQVTGFDCVDDESRLERNAAGNAAGRLPKPADWTSGDNPPYSYWIYYIFANLHSLNQLRRALGQTTFAFRPHAGEAGDVNNLAATFLCCQNINHGVLLRKAPALQYLYYLTQIGLAISPLSNNKLFLDYHASPFPAFFSRGLNVSLSTDDPLMLHITKEPLVEEYAVAAQVWKLSSTDMCEIAKASVLQSGFEHPYKEHFLGKGYLDEDACASNNITYTNVPDIRVIYRRERLDAEWAFVNSAAQGVPDTSP